MKPDTLLMRRLDLIGSPALFPAKEWRSVVGWPTYEVSNLGRVRRSIARNGRPAGSMLCQGLDARGYYRIGLYRAKKRISLKVHTLVCEAFHGPPPSPRHEVAHGDGIRTNNRSENLRWDTRAGNHADKLGHGTHNRGERHGNSKLTNDQAATIIADREAGRRIRSLAVEYGVCVGTIRRLIDGGSWAWLPRPPKRDHRRAKP